jgi:hypothetical protein
MSVKGGPNTVTSGLVLELDAGNIKSYPTTGTTWFDKSGYSNNGTLTNGPTFNTGSLGSIVFDGVDDHVSTVSNPIVTNQITCDAWVNLDTSNITGSVTAGWIMGRENNYRLIYFTSSFSWICATVNNGWYSAGTNISYDYSSSINNRWFNIIGTYNGTYNSMYVNGQLLVTGSNISGNILSANPFYIARSQAVGSVNYGKGRGAIYKVYNRALSADEVLQNYNATKGRFGL